MSKDFRRPSEQDMELLMYHLVRVPEVIQAALRVLKLENFTPIVERKERLLWAISRDYFTEYKSPIPEQVMLAEIQKRTKGSTEFDNETVQGVYQKVYLYFQAWEGKIEPCAPYVIGVLNAFLYFKNVYDQLELHFKSGTSNPEMINSILERSKEAEVTAPMVVEPFALDSEDDFNTTPRVPTGVYHVDMLLDGGARPGEAYGFIAPSGGGKTTQSNQMACEYAARGNHVFVFTYEQPPDNDYMLPVRVFASRIPRSRMKEIRKLEDFTSEEKNRFLQAKQDIDRYLHFVDFSGCGGNAQAGSGGADEVERVLEGYRKQGIKPGAFIIDWFWPMVLRTTPEMEEGARRAFAKNQVLQFKQLAGKMKCWCWINQQLTSAEAGKKKTPEWNAAAELKSFAEYLDFCFVLGRLDSQHIGNFKSSKARGAAVLEKPVRLNGELARFDAVENEMEYCNRTNRWLPKDEMNKIPTDKMPDLSGDKNETQSDYEAAGNAFQ